MNFLNFKIHGYGGYPIIELDYLGKIYDLHNAGEFIRMWYDVSICQLRLEWDYMEEDSNQLIVIQFDKVAYLYISPRDNQMPNNEDSCLEQMIFHSNNALEFRFMGGMKIVVRADKAILKIVRV